MTDDEDIDCGPMKWWKNRGTHCLYVRWRNADGWKGEVPMPPPKEQAYGWKLEWDVEGAPRENFEGPVHQCAGSGDELSKLEVDKKRCAARQADTHVEP